MRDPGYDPLSWVKEKKSQREEKPAEQVEQNRPLSAQGLDPPLLCGTC